MSRHLKVLRASGLFEESHPDFDARVRIYSLRPQLMASRVLVALRVAVSPERAFDLLTQNIGDWWRPNTLFQFTAQGPGRLAFEPGPNGRLVQRLLGGAVFEIGRIRVWDRPWRPVFGWRQASFEPHQTTEVHVHFDPVDLESRVTRVTVEHYGWDTIPQDHVARHGFPLEVTQLRLAEWWQSLLRSYAGLAG